MNVLRGWEVFWFRPIELGHVGLFRIALGLVILMKLGLLWPVVGDYFSEQGMLTLEQSRWMVPQPRLCLFDWLPLESAPWVVAGMILMALCFTAGLWTRMMTVALWVGLVSIDQRNWLVLNTGDRLLAGLCFFGIFAPLGASWSLDRALASRRSPARLAPAMGSPWAVRLMQMQICIMYFWSVFNKFGDQTWRSGEALYWILRNLDRARWPLPSILADTMGGIHLLTYGTLLVEGAFPFLVWSRRFRGAILLAGAGLHLGIEYAMNIQIFQYVVLASYLLFCSGDTQLNSKRPFPQN